MSTIVRYECLACGRSDLGEPRFGVYEHFVEDPREGSRLRPRVCTGVRVKKTYVDADEMRANFMFHGLDTDQLIDAIHFAQLKGWSA